MPTPTDLLCESCGYPIASLPTTAPCPECGTPIAESLPERRTGSPFQRHSSFSSLLTTAAAALTHPRRLMRTLIIETPRSRALAWVYLLAASTCAAAALEIFTHHHTWRTLDDSNIPGVKDAFVAIDHAPIFLRAPAFFALFLAAYWVQVYIESRGVRFFGRRRQWRVTRQVAAAVGAHASVGWLLGSILALGLAPTIPRLTLYAVTTSSGVMLYPTPVYPLWPIAAALLLGLLTFETLVYIGIRQCRFANPPRSAPA